jgi:hypothetical protein
VDNFFGRSLMSGYVISQVDNSSTYGGEEIEPPSTSLDLVLGFFDDFHNGAFLGGILIA